MGFLWQGGLSLDALTERITVNAENIGEGAVGVIAELVEEGEALMRGNIDAAETPTGLRRQETGGRSSRFGSTHTGRRDSDTMYNAVESDVSAELGADTVVVRGSFGWLQDILEYFIVQEDGLGHVPPMHALADAFGVIRQRFGVRIAGISKGNA